LVADNTSAREYSIDKARCALYGGKLHSRMSLVPTKPVRLKLLRACDQWHSSRVATFLPVGTVNSVPTLKVDIFLGRLI
jgi:hypothetical protein